LIEIKWHQQNRGISKKIVPILIIFVVALALRLQHINVDFAHPDEPIAIGVVSGMLEAHTLDTNWNNYDVGQFRYNQYNFSSYHVALAGLGWLLQNVLDHSLTLADIRCVSAVLGALAVPAIFLLGCKLGGSIAGFFAAVLTAVSPQLIFNSTFARAESFFTLLFICAVLLAISEVNTSPPRKSRGLTHGVIPYFSSVRCCSDT
jgi:predicted membrane-bound mannosyltransferase